MDDKQERTAELPAWYVMASIAGTCILGSLLVFGGSLAHGFSMIDDPYLVTQNLFVRGLTPENIRYVFTHFDPELYMPLTFLSYQLDYVLGGMNPAIFHFNNILLHGINASLVMMLLWLLINNRTAAILGGLLFLVHPLNTEAVVWVAGRKDLLSTGLFLGSLIMYLLHQQADLRHDAAATGKKWYWLSILLFLLALLSKAMVLTLPAVLLLFAFMRNDEHQPTATHFPLLTRLKSLIPFIILSAIFAVVAFIGKERIVQSSTLMETVLMASKSTIFYLQKLFWPTGLNPIYPYHDSITIGSPDFYWPVIILIVISAATIISLKWTNRIAIGLAFFLITLSPTFLNFHKGTVTFFAVDRYAYLPMIGILIIVTGHWSQVTGHKLRIKRPSTSDLRPATFILGIVTLSTILILAILAFNQTSVWASDERLLTRSLILYPDSIPTRTSLSVIYRQTGRINEERSVIEAGLTYRDDVAYRTGLGSIFAREGKTDEARHEYERARLSDPENPEPLFYLGSLEEQLNNEQTALELYRQAIALDDSYVGAYVNAGAILLDRGDFVEAEKLFRIALSWNPNTMEANYNLFDVLERQKRQDEAFPYLVRAYKLNPNDPDIGLAYAYRLNEREDADKAKRILEHLMELDPNNRGASRLLQAIENSSNR